MGKDKNYGCPWIRGEFENIWIIWRSKYKYYLIERIKIYCCIWIKLSSKIVWCIWLANKNSISLKDKNVLLLLKIIYCELFDVSKEMLAQVNDKKSSLHLNKCVIIIDAFKDFWYIKCPKCKNYHIVRMYNDFKIKYHITEKINICYCI